MESDELYDSLDDDDPPKSARKKRINVLFDGTSKRISSDSEDNAPTLNTPRSDRKTNDEVKRKDQAIYDRTTKRYENLKKIETECDIADVVPLYDGETPKRQLKKTMGNGPKLSKNTGSSERTRFCSLKGVKGERGNGKNDDLAALNFREQKTYSNIFHARMGRLNPERKETSETARAECGEETNRSDVSDVSSHFSDAKSSISDTTSFYIDLILKKKDPSSKLPPSKSSKSLKNPEAESPQGSDPNFKSVSQFIPSASTRRKSKSKLCIVTPPVLGSLGPDMEAIQEKLSLLKKRRSYGQKVSERNRIRIREKKILKDLSEEIKKARM